MPDWLDKAKALEQKEREAILAKHPRKTIACSLTHCEDCNDPIPEARRQNVVGCTRCIDCQTLYEQKQKHYRSR